MRLRVHFGLSFLLLCFALLGTAFVHADDIEVQSDTDGNRTTIEPTTTTTPNATPTTTPEITTVVTGGSTEEPTPSSAPTPTHPPVESPTPFDVSVNGSDDKTCIKAKLAVQFNVQYRNKNGTNSTATFNIDQPISVTGMCANGSTTETVTITFGNDTQQNNLTMLFKKVESTILIDLEVYIFEDENNFFDSENQGKYIQARAENVTKFSVDHSYKCSKGSVEMNNGVSLSLFDYQLQAFSHTDNFVTAEICEADEEKDSSDVVPIAVGIALAALVIIVLIAYLIGRRRSRQKGYQSV